MTSGCWERERRLDRRLGERHTALRDWLREEDSDPGRGPALLVFPPIFPPPVCVGG